MGPQFVGGRPTGRPALKVRAARIGGGVASLPTEIGGFPVDVTVGPPPGPHALDVDAPGTFVRRGTRHMDFLRYRPVRGGVMLRSCDGTGVGTLGCMFWSPSTGKAYGSSCIHVLVPQVMTNRGNGLGTTVYQPDIFKRWTVPAEGDTDIGTVVDTARPLKREVTDPQFAPHGSYWVDLDFAMFELSPGTKWIPAITGIGGVAGAATDVDFDSVCVNGPYKVATRGANMVQTGGYIDSMSFYLKEERAGHPVPVPEPLDSWRNIGSSLIIRANPCPSATQGEGCHFSQVGDSGAAVVNAAREIVGFVRSGIAPHQSIDPTVWWDLDGVGRDFGDTYADPIGEVLSAIHASQQWADVEVAVAEAEDIGDIAERSQP